MNESWNVPKWRIVAEYCAKRGLTWFNILPRKPLKIAEWIRDADTR